MNDFLKLWICIAVFFANFSLSSLNATDIASCRKCSSKKIERPVETPRAQKPTSNGRSTYMQRNHPTPTYLYKIISVENWRKSQKKNQLQLADMDQTFIHLATNEQVPRIVEKFWKDSECVILKVESIKMKGDLLFEENPGGSNKYFHLYNGYIPFKAILTATPVPRS
jgi:uncharacterized protein (DUF952 family)